MNPNGIFVGIDVAKAHLDVAILGGQQNFRVPNDEAGIDDLADRLSPDRSPTHRPRRCVPCVTGGASGWR